MFVPSRASYSALKPRFNQLGGGGGNPYAPAVWSQSLQMPQAGQRIDFGNNLTNDGTVPFTWEGWVKFTIDGGTQIVMSKLDAGNRGWEVNINGGSGQPSLYIINTAGADWLNVRCNTAIANNTWTYISVSYDGSKTFGGVNWYVFGLPSTTINDGAATLVGSSSSSGPLQINARNSSTFGDQPMTYKEIQYHTSELSDAQILVQYNNGLPTDYLLTPTPPAHLMRSGDTVGDDATAGSGSIINTGTVGGFNGTPVLTVPGNIITDAP